MTKLGLKGVQILTNVAGKELSDPEFAPFWAKPPRQLGAVVLIHPNGFTEAHRIDPVLLQQRRSATRWRPPSRCII